VPRRSKPRKSPIPADNDRRGTNLRISQIVPFGIRTPVPARRALPALLSRLLKLQFHARGAAIATSGWGENRTFPGCGKDTTTSTPSTEIPRTYANLNRRSQQAMLLSQHDTVEPMAQFDGRCRGRARYFCAVQNVGNWPISAAPTACVRVRYEGYSCRAGSTAGAAVDDPTRTSTTISFCISEGVFRPIKAQIWFRLFSTFSCVPLPVCRTAAKRANSGSVCLRGAPQSVRRG
jgi:hypothetical protein